MTIHLRARTLCAALTLHLAGALVLATAARAEEELTTHQRLAHTLLRELVETDTTHSTGDTTRAARSLAERLWAAGFDEEDAVVLEEVPGKGNLVARLHGSDDSLEPILLLAHGRDERILIRSFFEGQEFLYRLVKRLSAPSTGAID